jgi:hypothetical protein
MSQAPSVERTAEWLIRTACRRLPADVRAERCREWAAELPAILDDEGVRPPCLRTLRVLTFSVGISRTTRQLSRATRAGAVETQHPDVAARALAGLVIWLVTVLSAITLLRAHPDRHGWPILLILALAVGFDAYCLVDIARAAQVRYLPKWAWVLICLIQAPGGGIMYLSLGHIARRRLVPPGDAQP